MVIHVMISTVNRLFICLFVHCVFLGCLTFVKLLIKASSYIMLC